MGQIDIIISIVQHLNTYADMAELVDAQDLKSCGLIIRPGSIPGICTNV